jgi:hypothetical protein
MCASASIYVNHTHVGMNIVRKAYKAIFPLSAAAVRWRDGNPCLSGTCTQVCGHMHMHKDVKKCGLMVAGNGLHAPAAASIANNRANACCQDDGGAHQRHCSALFQHPVQVTLSASSHYAPVTTLFFSAYCHACLIILCWMRFDATSSSPLSLQTQIQHSRFDLCYFLIQTYTPLCTHEDNMLALQALNNCLVKDCTHTYIVRERKPSRNSVESCPSHPVKHHMVIIWY